MVHFELEKHKLCCKFISVAFKSYVKSSKAQHVSAPTNMILPSNVLIFFGHVINAPKIGTHQNIANLFTLSSIMKPPTKNEKRQWSSKQKVM